MHDCLLTQTRHDATLLVLLHGGPGALEKRLLGTRVTMYGRPRLRDLWVPEGTSERFREAFDEV